MLNKIKRLFTSLLPVSKDRRGGCVGCGACCKLPFPCWFLKSREDGGGYCSIYAIRPPSCRKYPRTAGECLTADTCGFHFEKAEEPGMDDGVFASSDDGQPVPVKVRHDDRD